MVPPTFSFALDAEEDRALAVAPNPAAALAASESATTYPELRVAISYKIALSPHSGADQLDRDIQTAERRLREAPEPRPFLGATGLALCG